MQIILKCKHAYGSVGFPASRIEGLPIPERRYTIENGFVTLAGFSDTVLHHDCEELLAMPNGLYRMLTPLEQEAMVQAQIQASQVQENASVNSDGSEQGNASIDPNEPPAVDNGKKKANGG